MSWNAPSNVSTGNALTALLWNNLLGASGSLQFLYNRTLKHDITLVRTANTTVASGVTVFYTWEYAESANNFPYSGPSSNITIPQGGVWAYMLRTRPNVVSLVYFRLHNVTTGSISVEHIVVNPDIYSNSCYTGIFRCNTNDVINISCYASAANSFGFSYVNLCRIN